MRMSSRLGAGVCLLAVIGLPVWASAHGLAGKRFFPATIAVDDPFVADELSLPSVLHIKRPAAGDEPATRETELSFEWSKRITPDLGFSLEGELVHLDPERAPSLTGFGNLGVELKYQFFNSDAHETILSVALGWEVGGTGRKATEADSFHTVQPSLFFGKGLGDLPDALWPLRPLAVTGVVGLDIPTRARSRTVHVDSGPDGELEAEETIERHPHVFRWGVTLQYSLPYLQQFVRDVGLPGPLARLIPVVEVEMAHPLDRGHAGRFTGTVNPGLLWVGKYIQIGLEAVLPVNERTGKNVGIRGMIHFFLDDLFPGSLGRPLFGR